MRVAEETIRASEETISAGHPLTYFGLQKCYQSKPKRNGSWQRWSWAHSKRN